MNYLGGVPFEAVLVRRLLLLLAVLIALTALAGSIAPVPSPAPESGVTPAPSASPGATARRETGAPAVVRAALSAAPGRPARLIRARVGDHVLITVRGAAIDSVALGELEVEPVEPGVPARFDFLADDRGSYPLVLLDAGRRIGTLQVR
jgi:hypothetical protein